MHEWMCGLVVKVGWIRGWMDGVRDGRVEKFHFLQFRPITYDSFLYPLEA